MPASSSQSSGFSSQQRQKDSKTAPDTQHGELRSTAFPCHFKATTLFVLKLNFLLLQHEVTETLRNPEVEKAGLSTDGKMFGFKASALNLGWIHFRIATKHSIFISPDNCVNWILFHYLS